jgi:hypothetical protein
VPPIGAAIFYLSQKFAQIFLIFSSRCSSQIFFINKKAGAKNMRPPNWVIGRIHHKSFLNCTPGRVQRPGVLVVVGYFTI